MQGEREREREEGRARARERERERESERAGARGRERAREREEGRGRESEITKLTSNKTNNRSNCAWLLPTFIRICSVLYAPKKSVSCMKRCEQSAVSSLAVSSTKLCCEENVHQKRSGAKFVNLKYKKKAAEDESVSV